MLSLVWRFHGACKSVGEYFTIPRGMIARQGLEHDVVATLAVGCSIPRSVKGDEHAVAVVGRELLFVVEHHRVRCPMRRECRDRRALGRARSHLLAAVAAVFGSKNQFALYGVVVALRPPVVAALVQEQQLLGRLRSFLLGPVKIRPIRMQLIAPVLRDEDVSLSIDREALGIAYAGGKARGRRECLAGFVRVVAPNAPARLQLRAGVDARRFRRAVLSLAGVGRRGDIDVQGTVGSDRERMHGMIAAQRQSRHDRHRGTLRDDRVPRQRIAHDFIVDLSEQATLI